MKTFYYFFTIITYANFHNGLAFKQDRIVLALRYIGIRKEI